jgi:hypothetical protein
MRPLVVITIAAAAFGTARVMRVAAKSYSTGDQVEAPYAPSPGAAPFLSLGYREVAADLMYVRLRGYVGGGSQFTGAAVAELCEAMVELDPHFHRPYEFCANVMSFAWKGVDQSIYLRAIAILERGAKLFPADWKLPNLAGQIYTQDLKTDDPKQRREWDEKGTLLVESAIRKPGAPAELQAWASVMRSKLGQRERAIAGLREMLLLTTNVDARRVLIAKLAALEDKKSDAIAGELYEANRRFTSEWHEGRPLLPPTWYILIGPRPTGAFDMADLATGGRDLVTLETPAASDDENDAGPE